MILQDFINKALHSKFKNKGRNYDYCDCYGIIFLAYRDIINVELPCFINDYVDAGDTKASRQVINDVILLQKHNWNGVIKPQAMDVVLFRFGDTETHVGLMIDKKQFIHCEKIINTVIERIDSAKWKKRVEGIYRLKDKDE